MHFYFKNIYGQMDGKIFKLGSCLFCKMFLLTQGTILQSVSIRDLQDTLYKLQIFQKTTFFSQIDRLTPLCLITCPKHTLHPLRTHPLLWGISHYCIALSTGKRPNFQQVHADEHFASLLKTDVIDTVASTENYMSYG